MNEIPIELFIFMCISALGLIIFSLVYNENFVRIITSLIAMVLSYVNAQVILNGNVVFIKTDGTFVPITVPALNYIWLFLALLSFVLAILFIADMININMQDALDEKEAEEQQDFT